MITFQPYLGLCLLHVLLNLIFQPHLLVPVTAQDVLDMLQSLNVNKATGPDGIPVHILRLSVSVVMDSLAALFNESLQSGIFPSDWKKANVYPVFKAGDSQLLTKYTPISVFSSIAKVFETIVHWQVFSYFSSNGLLTLVQSGRSHSTQDLLLKVTEDCRCALDNDDLTGAVFIDLSKAFDSIDHAVVLAKLSAYGFDKTALHWFTNYLSSRQQRVVLDGSFSDWATVVRGMPQGSVLGPLLFKPGACQPKHAWFLEIAFIREVGMLVCMHACVCPPPRL